MQVRAGPESRVRGDTKATRARPALAALLQNILAFEIFLQTILARA
jgi:hypothetical protein